MILVVLAEATEENSREAAADDAEVLAADVTSPGSGELLGCRNSSSVCVDTDAVVCSVCVPASRY